MARDELAAFGVEGDWAVARRHAVRWAECDAYGHVNHAAYLTLCEDLRVGHWSALGGRFAPDSPGPVVAQLEARYLRPLGFEDEVLLTLRTASLRRTSYIQEDEVWHLGDFALGPTGPARAALLGRLQGRKHLVTGNNDPAATTGLAGWAS